ncbi:MAG: hypothetical protein MK100_06950 [Phycisphaerales bacterium]|nr:hypothetical protein [Phycisphaerales bacterium]
MPLQPFTAVLVAAVISGSAAGTSWTNPRETAVHQELDRAISPQPGGAHLLRLSALRALRDIRLRPLLVSLTEGNDPAIQVHALLGLAELSENGFFDLPRLQAADPIAVEAAIMVGLENNRLDTLGVRDVLELPNLTAATQLRLLAELISVGATVSREEIEAIPIEGGSTLQARQASLLSALGHPSEIESLTQKILQDPEKANHLEAAIAALEQFQAIGMQADERFLLACAQADMPPGVRRFALLTMLEQNVPGIDELFCSEAERTTRRRERVDLALLLLMSNSPVPARCRPLFESDELLTVLATAADAQASNHSSLTSALVAGVESRHRRTISWLLDSMGDRPDTLAIPLIELILDKAVAADLKFGTGEQGVLAASQLLDRSPDRFRIRLATAADDSTEQQLLLLALVQQPAPELYETVSEIHRIGLGNADVLALLVLARDGETLDPVDVERLKLVAASSTDSEAVRTQAAWLAVRHTGIVDDVMAALVKTPR